MTAICKNSFRIIKPHMNEQILFEELQQSQADGCMAVGIDLDSLADLKTGDDAGHFGDFTKAYDKELLKKIRENAYGYFHGHEVGGTNPSLLEALGSTDLNLLLKVGFNQEVAEDAALYWTKDDGNLAALGLEGDVPAARREELGEIVDYVSGRNRYVGYLISLAAHSYKNMRVGLDCANGSSWNIAKTVFEALGAKTFVINAEPDGVNINRGAGSTHIDGLRRFVVENHLDVGFAYDGDADRCLAVDENGEVVDGDKIIYIFGCQMKREGKLAGNKVVTTVMSNFGLYKALDEAGIGYEKTAVGDRFVYENMSQNGYCVGGEQSGHIILSKYATTGDGILTSIELMEAMLDTKQTLSRLAAPVTVVKAVGEKLGDTGRVLLRESGTEPVIRVMAEAQEQRVAEACVNEMIDAIKAEGLA